MDLVISHLNEQSTSSQRTIYWSLSSTGHLDPAPTQIGTLNLHSLHFFTVLNNAEE